jgi:hypothetical protein
MKKQRRNAVVAAAGEEELRLYSNLRRPIASLTPEYPADEVVDRFRCYDQ